MEDQTPDYQPLEPQEPVSQIPQSMGVNVEPVRHYAQLIRTEIGKVVVGQHEIMDQMLTAILTGGHVLLEGVPGIAKTLMARLLARTIQSGFSRIQFTPDLMPADVTGSPVFNMKTGEFQFKQGPIFSNIILIDEINRAPAKTQSSLFEVMEERQVTVDGITYKMGAPFFVVATQNPIEQEGTYKLPEAQLDRFIFKINMEYPSLQDEKLILRLFQNDFAQKVQDEVKPVIKPEALAECRAIIEQVYARPEILDYIAEIVHTTRSHPDLYLGASPRASLALLKTSKAVAALSGRNFVTPDDVRYVAYPALNHRIILTPDREIEGVTPREVIDDIVHKIEVPR
jgi:MoxR-like ATPase